MQVEGKVPYDIVIASTLRSFLVENNVLTRLLDVNVEKMDNKELRVSVKHKFLMGKDTVQTKKWLEKCYGESASWKTMICKWFSNFKLSNTYTNDAEGTKGTFQIAEK